MLCEWLLDGDTKSEALRVASLFCQPSSLDAVGQQQEAIKGNKTPTTLCSHAWYGQATTPRQCGQAFLHQLVVCVQSLLPCACDTRKWAPPSSVGKQAEHRVSDVDARDVVIADCFRGRHTTPPPQKLTGIGERDRGGFVGMAMWGRLRGGLICV